MSAFAAAAQDEDGDTISALRAENEMLSQSLLAMHNILEMTARAGAHHARAASCLRETVIRWAVRAEQAEEMLEAIGAGGVGKLEQPQSVTYCHQSQPQGEQEPNPRWPSNASEVRAFLSGRVATERYARDDHQPDDNDTYTLSAHDLLEAIDWWTDFDTQPKRQPLDTDMWPEYPAPSVRPVYATSANTKSVRDGFEVGGYEKTPPLFTKSQLYDYALNVLRAHKIGGEA